MFLKGKISIRLVQSLCGLQDIIIKEVNVREGIIYVVAQTRGIKAQCNTCGKTSRVKRASYVRKISGLPIAGYRIILQLRVYKYLCCNPKCSKKIFSEQIQKLTSKYGRRTQSVNERMMKICAEVSSNKAAYISGIINNPMSSSSCLRLIKSIEVPPVTDLKCIGIDDWAKRKGINYGSIIVNAETHKTIDLIDSRNESDIISWLSMHPEIEYVTRDRASYYASAIRKALPHAKQIADKFHLVKNLSDAAIEDVKNIFSKIHQASREVNSPIATSVPISEKIQDEIIYQGELEKRKAKLKLFCNLKKEGLGYTAIARRTGVSRDTVRRYLCEGVPRVKSKAVINYNQYLDDIYEMCEKKLNPSAMYRQLKLKGFKGCIKSFTGWFHTRFPDYQFKWNRDYTISTTNTKGKVNLPLFKRFSIVLLNKEYGISKQTGEISSDRLCVDSLVDTLPELREMQDAFSRFRDVINGESVSALESLCEEMKSLSLKNMCSFFKDLRKDWDAVCNAIRYKWTNGLIEGSVNRLKSKKREMYGKAGFELLRKKVFLSITG